MREAMCILSYNDSFSFFLRYNFSCNCQIQVMNSCLFFFSIFDVRYVYIDDGISSMSTMAAVLYAQLKGQANRWATRVNVRRSLFFFYFESADRRKRIRDCRFKLSPLYVSRYSLTLIIIIIMFCLDTAVIR